MDKKGLSCQKGFFKPIPTGKEAEDVSFVSRRGSRGSPARRLALRRIALTRSPPGRGLGSTGAYSAGLFSGLELNYDATQLLFAATTSADVWRIFKFNLAAKQLVQLTDGPWDTMRVFPEAS